MAAAGVSEAPDVGAFGGPGGPSGPGGPGDVWVFCRLQLNGETEV